MKTILICAVCFFVAVGVRFLHAQDNRPAIPFYGMTGEYKAHAMTLVHGEFRVFLRGPNPPSDADVIKHPPGYPLLMAAVYKVFGDSDRALQIVHILLDAAAAILVFILAAEMFPFGVASVAGLLVAFSPQLAYHSIALLPDPITAAPLLLAAYFLVRAYKHPRLRTIAASGALVGISCWLRSNALLLPFFLAALSPIFFKPGKRLRMTSALVVVSLVVMAPITIRNWIFFRSFIPLSLSAGITMLEGISIYDKDGKFGLPDSDYKVTKWEAREFNRPDYLGTRFTPDGVVRERYRLKRSLEVVRAHPFWFAGVMARRASFMLRLARVELVRPQPAVAHSLDVPPATQPSWTISPSAMAMANRQTAAGSRLTLAADGQALRSEGSAPNLLISNPIAVTPNTDYLLRVPLKIEYGSAVVEVRDAQSNAVLASTPILHPVNWLDLTPEQQPVVIIDTPFVSGNARAVRIALTNGGRGSSPIEAEVRNVEAFSLGDSSQTGTHYPRVVLRLVQKFFITAIMLPFTLLGVILLARSRRWRELGILLVVPVYYMCVQSALWTEFRYILTMHYFLFILAAVGLVWTSGIVKDLFARLRPATRRGANRAGSEQLHRTA